MSDSSGVQVTVPTGSLQTSVIDVGNQLYQYAQTIFQQLMTMFNGKVAVSNISTIVLQAMLAIRDYTQLLGDDKKTVVIQALLLLINSQPIDPATKTLLIMLINTLVPVMIDDLYWVGEQAIKFQKTHGCFGFCKPKPPQPNPTPTPTPNPTPTPAPVVPVNPVVNAQAPPQSRRQQYVQSHS